MKTLYIIHGWAYSVDPWKKTLERLEKDGFKVKMLKVPGLTEKSEKVFTIDDYVKWADKNLPQDAVVLGHSNGGRILLNLLQNNPKRVSHLILLDAAGIYEPSKKRDILRTVSKLGAPLKKVPILAKVYHKAIGASDYERAPENMKKTLSNMLESDRFLTFDKITTKTTILWGEEDTITPPRQARKLHERLKNSTLTFYPRWTHAPYICDPEGLAEALEGILRREK